MSYNLIEQSAGIRQQFEEPGFTEYRQGFESSFSMVDKFPIAGAHDPFRALDKGFEMLLDSHQFLYQLEGALSSYKRDMQDIRENWQQSGISQPEIRKVVFEILQGLGMWQENHLKTFLMLSVVRSGSESGVIIYTGSRFMEQLSEPEQEILIALADSADEMFGKRSIDDFRNRAGLGDIPSAKMAKFFNSGEGNKLRRFGAIEWFCETTHGRAAKYKEMIRPLFADEISGGEYQHYLTGKLGYIRRKYAEIFA